MNIGFGAPYVQQTAHCHSRRVHHARLCQPNYEHLIAGFKPGSTLEINGYIPEYADRFEVNLLSEQPNITLFHFNPRFPEQEIVRNRCVNDSWDHREERHGGFPLRTGSHVRIEVIAEAKWFRVLINGIEHSKFEYRHTFEQISHVSIKGDFNPVECNYIAPL